MRPLDFSQMNKGGDIQLGSVLRRRDGFSLLELMVSLFILAVSILGLLSLTTVSIQTNLQNDIRDGATRLTNQTAEILLAQPIASIVTCGLHADPSDPVYNSAYTYSALNTCLGGAGIEYTRYPNPVQTIRGERQYSYNITWTVTNLTNDLRQADIVVKYVYRGQPTLNQTVLYTHKTL